MSQKSMLESAYQILSKGKKTSFTTLWKKVCQDLGFSEEEAQNKVSRFYTLLTLDGRFAFLQGNYWDLSERLKYEDVHVSVSDYYAEEIEPEDEDEDDKEYKKLYTGEEEKPVDDTPKADDEADGEETPKEEESNN